ncbi:MAG: DNA mismatch repair protein, partial [Planctomycetaceae bacterium]|nr:DNA mismatch repair protein [Planctomycetaceae bacterium]
RHKATAGDLDLFGHASLFQWICRCETRSGTTTLRDWLLEPAVPSEILLRQDAIKELAPRARLREELQLLGRRLRDYPSGPDRMIEWTESPDWLLRRPWVTWLVRLLPALFVASGLTLLLWESGQPVWLALFSLLGCHFLLSLLFGGQVHTRFHHVSSGRGEVQNYLELFHLMEQEPAVATKLVSLQQQATLEHGGIHLRLRQLGAIMVLANLRHSAITFPLWLVLQLGLLWDFHVLAVLETWKRRHGSQVRSWFTALGEYEALASLAAVHHDDPDWSFPTIAPAGKPLQARGLGHPLLTDASRVANDIEIGNPHCCLLVTGSNMSGKSTLLRSTGLNLTLAQMGSPVCATHWESPPLRVMTSMRVSDSLDQGVSFYFAELQRLKEIVDTVRNRTDPTQPQVLFLLDEILQGTNSRERHIAVQQVLTHLLKEGAMGAVSTHDLDLAQIEPLRSACRPVHFRETVETTETGMRMDFDYQLREGVATTTNALQLLKIVGLTNLS